MSEIKNPVEGLGVLVELGGAKQPKVGISFPVEAALLVDLQAPSSPDSHGLPALMV